MAGTAQKEAVLVRREVMSFRVAELKEVARRLGLAMHGARILVLGCACCLRRRGCVA